MATSQPFTFRLRGSKVRPGVRLVDVLTRHPYHPVLVATITPTSDGLRISSRYLDGRPRYTVREPTVVQIGLQIPPEPQPVRVPQPPAAAEQRVTRKPRRGAGPPNAAPASGRRSRHGRTPTP
jgi:hypothetical protein